MPDTGINAPFASSLHCRRSLRALAALLMVALAPLPARSAGLEQDAVAPVRTVPDAPGARPNLDMMTPTERVAPDAADIALLERVSGALVRVAEFARPSVVSIRTRTPTGRGRHESASGSGVIFDADGHIVTSCHVVKDADRIDVRLADGRRFRARVVGTDPKTDVAVLRIAARGITPARFADSAGVQVGQLVLAIGSPFALAQTVTHGIVSATGRTDVDMEEMEYQNFIQTDAPTNPGNSGGALVNVRGEVIGINTAIASRSGQFAGIAFATPSNTVVWAARGIISGRPLVRGYIGVTIEPLSADVADETGLSTTLGVRIRSVAPDSPAQRAGLRAGDIVLRINNLQVGDPTQLLTLIAEQAPGTRAMLTIWREGAQHRIEVTLGEQPRDL